MSNSLYGCQCSPWFPRLNSCWPRSPSIRLFSNRTVRTEKSEAGTKKMLQKFFGLSGSPFNGNPDPRYLFLTKQIQEALAGLTYGIQNRKGFILLTGEVGTGKTTLLNRLLDWLHGQRVKTAFVFNSQVNVSQLFDFIMAEFEIPCDSGEKSHVLLKLNHWLLERYRAGETAVLIVDEAQNLSLQVLE